MIATATINQTKTLSSSEIFRLNFSNINIMCFQLKPEIEQEEAISLSFHLSRILPHIVVIWDKPYFYALGKFKNSMQYFGIDWESILEQIAAEGIKDFSDRTWQFQEVPLTKAVPANVISLLAYQVLKTSKPYPFSSITALSKNGVQVRREAEFWAEPIEIDGTLQAAITLTIKNKFLLTKSLAVFYLNHPDKHNPEEVLIGLNVRSLSGDIQGNGTITDVIKEPSLIQKQKLIRLAKSEISKQALQDDLSDQLLVAVKFGKGKKLYEYGMAALRPCVTSETASRFGVEWGELLKQTKIPYQKRKELLVDYKKEANQALGAYGFELGLSINNFHNRELFWQPQVTIENTRLLFGNGFIGTQNQIIIGLSKGSIYRRHVKYSDTSRPIRITVINLCENKLDDFIDQLKQRLKIYKFESLIVTTPISIKNLSGTEARVKVEKAVNEVIETPPDIVLAFLPQSDRNADEQEGGSLYHKIYDLLLRRQIASQMIYQDTLRNPKNYKNILHQVVPGILAKLGNLPFVLAEPLPIADYFIGLDISRESKRMFEKSGML